MTRSSHLRAVSAAAAVLALLATAATADPALAESPGTPMWSAPSTDYTAASNRVIRLAHSGSSNGTLLGTFETTRRSGAGNAFIVRRSTDDGRSWSTAGTAADGETGGTHPWDKAWQPSLFEFPTALGGYPAGTLLLVGNVADDGDSGNPTATHFQSWRSTDHGSTWQFVGVLQQGGGLGHGIWEPFVSLNGNGDLTVTFADERQKPTWSQYIGHIVSTDGGATWSANPDGSTRVAPGLVKDVASATASDRPGMPTIADLPDGKRILAYEVCGRSGAADCAVATKVSSDGGTTWGSGPSDVGTPAVTTDGWGIKAAPYVAWVPGGGASGTVLLTAQYAGTRGGVLLTNSAGGVGAWGWAPRPFVPGTTTTDNCLSNYSGSILPSVNGLFARVTAATATGSNGCEETTDTADPGLLPFAGDFSTGRSRGWLDYGGCWSVSAAVYTNTCPQNGDKSVAGNSSWTDVTMQADVRLSSTASGVIAGLDLRLGNPGVGPTAQSDYFAGVTGSTLLFGRHAQNWTQLGAKSIPGGLAAGAWYHLVVQASGCTFRIQGLPVGGTGSPLDLTVTDSGCRTAGAVGVQSYGGSSASFRNVTVTPGAAPSANPGTYLAPFASGAEPGWSTFGGTWSVSGPAETLSNTTGGSGEKQLLTASSAWGDYTLTTDVSASSLTGSATAGVLVRASGAAVGADALNGYFVGLTPTGLVIGREQNAWTSLATATLPGGLASGTAYHLTVTAKGCSITATAVSNSDPTDAVQATATDCTFSSGAVGVRTWRTPATWKQFAVTAS